MADDEPDRFRVIEASGPIDEIHKKVCRLVDEFLSQSEGEAE
jgi:thymidylate kinase